MIIAGKGVIPVFFLYFIILAVYPVLSSDILFYSLPIDKINAQFQEEFQWQYPTREPVLLNGKWSLKDRHGKEILGQVTVPSSYLGNRIIVFEKKFNLKKHGHRKYILHLKGINGNFRLLLNEQLLYEGSENYLPLSLLLPEKVLKNGANLIQIRLQSYQGRPGELPSWFPINLPRVDSGILNSVFLESVPIPSIQDIQIIPFIDGNQIFFRGKMELHLPFPSNSQHGLRISYYKGPQVLGTMRLELDSLRNTHIDLPEWEVKRPQPWEPTNPQLYFAEAVLDSAGKTVDVVRRSIALRSVSIQQNRLLINHEPITLQGVNYVYQNPEGTELFDIELARRDLQWLKEQGFNAIRVILHPLPEAFYRLCDELGLLCFQDLPFIFTGKTRLDNASLSHWIRYYQHVEGLALRHASITGIGLAFYMDMKSMDAKREFNELLKALQPGPLPVYLSSPNPQEENISKIGFQFVEIIQRNRLESELQKFEPRLSHQLLLPSGFSKAISYRIDSTTVTHDLLQIKQLYRILLNKSRNGEFQGHFIPTYSDFYLNDPSLQNGSRGDYYLNRIGLVNLKRQPRSMMELTQRVSTHEKKTEELIISEARSAHSYLYILIGFINVFLFLWFYQKFTEFRQNLHYSIKKPHGFFVNLQERIIIPYGQSLFLLFVISLNGAITLSSLAFYFRNNLLFDYLLSLFCYPNRAKLILSQLIWNQPLFLVTGTLGIIIIFYLLAIALKLFSFWGEARVPFRQAVAVSVWSASPFVFLLPLGIFLYNLLLTMKSYWILIVVLLYFHVWFYFRWINGTRVITENLYSRVFAIVSVLGFVLVGAVFFFYQNKLNILEHLQFILHLYTATN